MADTHNATIEGLDGEYPELIWFHPRGPSDPEKRGYIRLDSYLELAKALRDARALADNIGADGKVTDPVLFVKCCVSVRKAYDTLYAKAFTAGVAQ